MTIRELGHEDLKSDFVQDFAHEQVYGRVWKKRDGRWRLEEVETPTVRSWDAGKRLWVPEYLETMRSAGGCILGGFAGDVLAGFLALDGRFGGAAGRTLNLAMLFVDDRYQRQGVGRRLFAAGMERARRMGAETVFLSAVPTEETVAFYFAMGCEDAEEVVPKFVDTSDDRYLRFSLSTESRRDER